MSLQFITNPLHWSVDALGNLDSIDWSRYDDRVALNFTGVPPRFRDSSDKQLLDFDIVHPIHAERRTQDDGISWNGGFDADESLLFTSFLPGPINLVFQKPLRGIRTRIEARDAVPFRAIIRTFADDVAIELPDGGVRDDGVPDGPALTIGFLEGDTSINLGITVVEFQIQVLSDDYDGNAAFAIGRIDLVLQ